MIPARQSPGCSFCACMYLLARPLSLSGSPRPPLNLLSDSLQHLRVPTLEGALSFGHSVAHFSHLPRIPGVAARTHVRSLARVQSP
eukprot:3399416-Rhodomonas_salina.2